MTPARDHAERVEVRTQAELLAWLAEHHARPDGVWLVTFKKHTGDAYLSWSDSVDALLCWGWVDSLARRLDADRTMLWIAPQRPGSGWSPINKRKVAALEAEDRIQPPGRAVIDAAKADGSWTVLDPLDTLTPPDDLAEALAAADAFDAFDALLPSTRRVLLEQILLAKRPGTREKRIAAAVRAARERGAR